MRDKSLALIATLLGLAQPLAAQEAKPHIALELNALEAVDTSCRASFLASNSHKADIAKAVYEVVLFDQDGRVDRLMLLDFGDLPAGKQRLRQFAIPDLACASLGRILLNGAQTCDGDDIDAALCSKDLELTTRTEAEFSG